MVKHAADLLSLGLVAGSDFDGDTANLDEEEGVCVRRSLGVADAVVDAACGAVAIGPEDRRVLAELFDFAKRKLSLLGPCAGRVDKVIFQLVAMRFGGLKRYVHDIEETVRRCLGSGTRRGKAPEWSGRLRDVSKGRSLAG